MKKKTVWSLLLALAMTVTAIGASTAAFAAAPNQAEPQTLIATENEDAIWDQIEALEEKSDAVFQRNEALWDKVDEACNALPDDYDFEGTHILLTLSLKSSPCQVPDWFPVLDPSEQMQD